MTGRIDVISRRAKRYTASYTRAFATQMYKDLGVRVVVFSLQKDEDDEIKVGLYVQLDYLKLFSGADFNLAMIIIDTMTAHQL